MVAGGGWTQITYEPLGNRERIPLPLPPPGPAAPAPQDGPRGSRRRAPTPPQRPPRRLPGGRLWHRCAMLCPPGASPPLPLPSTDGDPPAPGNGAPLDAAAPSAMQQPEAARLGEKRMERAPAADLSVRPSLPSSCRRSGEGTAASRRDRSPARPAALPAGEAPRGAAAPPDPPSPRPR